MSFGIKSIEHALAIVGNDIVRGAKALVLAASKIENNAPAIEAITALVSPEAAIIERAAFTALGLLTKAANDVATVPNASALLNVNVDAQMIADFKALYEYLSAQAATAGITVSKK